MLVQCQKKVQYFYIVTTLGLHSDLAQFGCIFIMFDWLGNHQLRIKKMLQTFEIRQPDDLGSHFSHQYPTSLSSPSPPEKITSQILGDWRSICKYQLDSYILDRQQGSAIKGAVCLLNCSTGFQTLPNHIKSPKIVPTLRHVACVLAFQGEALPAAPAPHGRSPWSERMDGRTSLKNQWTPPVQRQKPTLFLKTGILWMFHPFPSNTFLELLEMAQNWALHGASPVGSSSCDRHSGPFCTQSEEIRSVCSRLSGGSARTTGVLGCTWFLKTIQWPVKFTRFGP